MLNGLDVNFRYLEHVTQAMDMITDKLKEKPDDGRLSLGTKERREQEEYFGEGEEPEEEDEAE